MTTPVSTPISNIEQLLSAKNFDSLIIIAESFKNLEHDLLTYEVAKITKVDARVGNQLITSISSAVPGKRLILAPTGPLARDYDDVRRYFDAAKEAVVEAQSMGSQSPAFYFPSLPANFLYTNAIAVSYLGACQALWRALEARENGVSHLKEVKNIGLIATNEHTCIHANAIALGQSVARDLCSASPERMTPSIFAGYCHKIFDGSEVKIEVVEGTNDITQQYPLLAAVARASLHVERHKPKVIKIEYTPKAKINKTLLLVGKGVVYDTGGADLKVAGSMAGMSHDKGGAAAVIGLIKAMSTYKSGNTKVLAYVALVRNSIGSDCFVPDEIVTSREGIRVRIGNTDAEGRLAMGDLLSEAKDRALLEKNSEIITIATLTGHAVKSYGPYSAFVENGAAKKINLSESIVNCGELWGEPSEISILRREDYDFIKPSSSAEDISSSNNGTSAMTTRGHQYPAAFLTVVSGLNKYSHDSKQPIPYVHIDIAGSCVENGNWLKGKPTSSPLVSLFANYIGK